MHTCHHALATLRSTRGTNAVFLRNPSIAIASLYIRDRAREPRWNPTGARSGFDFMMEREST